MISFLGDLVIRGGSSREEIKSVPSSTFSEPLPRWWDVAIGLEALPTQAFWPV